MKVTGINLATGIDLAAMFSYQIIRAGSVETRGFITTPENKAPATIKDWAQALLDTGIFDQRSLETTLIVSTTLLAGPPNSVLVVIRRDSCALNVGEIANNTSRPLLDTLVLIATHMVAELVSGTVACS